MGTNNHFVWVRTSCYAVAIRVPSSSTEDVSERKRRADCRFEGITSNADLLCNRQLMVKRSRNAEDSRRGRIRWFESFETTPPPF